MTLISPVGPNNNGGAAVNIAAPPSTTLEFNPASNVSCLILTGATAITATLVVPGNLYGQARPDVAYSIGTSSNRLIGPLSADLADPTTGLVTITLSATTNVTILPIVQGGGS